MHFGVASAGKEGTQMLLALISLVVLWAKGDTNPGRHRSDPKTITRSQVQDAIQYLRQRRGGVWWRLEKFG